MCYSQHAQTALDSPTHKLDVQYSAYLSDQNGCDCLCWHALFMNCGANVHDVLHPTS